MIKFFFLAEFEYSNGDETERFDLGIFTSKSKAEEKINIIKNKPGFNNYDQSFFKIIKFGVNFDRNEVNKEKATLFSVWVEYPDEKNLFYYVIFDYFSSYQKAKAKVNFLKNHSRIGKKHPEKLKISKININDFSSWLGGFEKYSF